MLIPFGYVPKIDARAVHPDATVEIIQANSIPGTATIKVTAADGRTKQTYTINMYPPQYADLRLKYTYGESGTGASGNFSRTYTDMTALAPGFELAFSRTYNSTDNRIGPMGRGWTFGFEFSIKDSKYENVKEVTLPDGSVQLFKWDGSEYIAENSRSELLKYGSDGHILITKDQYRYIFDGNGYLVEMVDRYGNTVNIKVDSFGRVSEVKDQAGNLYNIVYQNGLIKNIVDVKGGRTITYEYTSDGRLTKVTDAEGINTYYKYKQYVFDLAVGPVYVLSEILDHNNNTVERIEYYLDGENVGKVETLVDRNGNRFRYEYYPQYGYNIIYDSNNYKQIKWYDERYSYSRVSDEVGDVKVKYYLDDKGENKYGEEKSVTDRNGNTTIYERDSNGNVIKIINPDGSEKIFKYNSYNDVIFQQDEEGNKIYYVYDRQKLKHKIETINKSDSYNGEAVDSSIREKFAVTSYEYYSDEECRSLGYLAKGLVKSVTDPDGNVTRYTYYPDGNVKTETNPETGLPTVYEYNSYGLVTSKTTPGGYRTEYTYDKNGNLIKEELKNPYDPSKNSITRTIYDDAGRKVQVIPPNLYNSKQDNISKNTYSDSSAGTRYAYNTKGQIKSVTDAEGNTTNYEYDVYGNVVIEEMPNGGVYKYEYNPIGRIVKKSFKNSMSSGSFTTLEEYQYVQDKNPQKTIIRHLNSSETAKTTVTYDYAGREIEVINPPDIDNKSFSTKSVYYKDGRIKEYTDERRYTTYYNYDKYDSELKMKYDEKWIPAESSGSNVLYSYTRTYYNASGRVAAEWYSPQLVKLNEIPSTFIKKTTEYYADGQVKYVEFNDGRRTDYSYDNDGNLSSERTKKDANEEIRIEYENNHFGKPEIIKQYVRRGDIAGNSFDDNRTQVIATEITYDLEGNVETVVKDSVYKGTPNSKNIKTYTYDKLGRETGTIEYILDSDETLKKVEKRTTLNWEGEPLTEEILVNDMVQRRTAYEYDKRGFLTKVTEPGNRVTLYEYDRGGRLIAKVLPENYIPNTSISNMNRNVYTYDKLDRVITEGFTGVDGKFDENGKWNESSSKTTIIHAAYKYDGAGNVIKKLDAVAYKNASGSDAAQKIEKGYGTEYAYNPMNKVTAVLDAESKEKYNRTLSSAPQRFKYDALGRKMEEIVLREKANGTSYSIYESITKFTYDDAGNIIKTEIRKEDGTYVTVASAAYDYLGNAITKTDGNGNTTIYSYNAFGKVRSETTPGDDSIESNTIKYQYDTMGNLRAVQRKNSTSYDTMTYIECDNHGRILKKTVESAIGTDSISESYKHDIFGNARFKTDANGNVKEYRYNDSNELVYEAIEVTNINGDTTLHTATYEYDKSGNMILKKDHLGNEWVFVYDNLNRLREKKDPYGESIERINYNENNVQTESFDAKGNKTVYNYDKNSRLILTIDPEGNEKSQTYDIAGNVKTKFDGKNTTYLGYDYLGRNISVSNIVDGEIQTTTYEYDNNGNLIVQTNAKGHKTIYEYNAQNKLMRRIDNGGRTGKEGNYSYVDGRVESYSYNPDGTLKSKTDRKGQKTNYTYDIHGRLLQESVGKITISYTYDGNGNQLTMTDSTGTTVRTYDELGRMTSKTVPGIGKITYLYDVITKDGLVAQMSTDPKGNKKTEIFDKTGRLKAVKNGDVNEKDSAVYEYYPDGSRKSVVYESGLSSEYTYYNNGLLKTLRNKKADGSIMDEYSYTYDEAGNQVTKKEYINGKDKGTTIYTYDELNRLETVTEPSSRITTYSYDKAGNREVEIIEHNGEKVVNTYEYDDRNRLEKITTRVNGSVTETTSYTYDNNGNQLMVTKNGERTVANTYDEKNQLVRTNTKGSTVINVYNGEGLRVEKETKGFLTRYLYENLNVILETDERGNEKARNLYGLNLLMRDVDSESYYYLYNGHADVTALINTSTGEVSATYYYDAFGNILESTGDVNNNITYAGYQWDEETGLYYLNARMYDPKVARFLQEDTYWGNPNDPLSLNLYTYCSNNPIMYFDPLGHNAVNIQVGDVKVKNAAVSGGKTIGNLNDIVKGLEGEVKKVRNGFWWCDVIEYEVYFKNPETGKKEKKITYNLETMKDSFGNDFSVIDGRVQGQVRQLAELAGLDDTISWWHDKDKKLNVLVRPELKNAPVQITRSGSKISIKAYADIGGEASTKKAWEVSDERDRKLTSNFNSKSFKELVSEGFKLWEGNYNMNGERVTVSVDVIHKNKHEEVSSNSNQRYLKIEIRDPEKESSQSHVKINPFKRWSIKNPVKYVRLYTGHLRNGVISYDDWGGFKAVTAHEFGHVLGISDAYDVSAERLIGGRKAAPEVIIDKVNGEEIIYETPKNAIMRSGFREGDFVTDYDIKLMWDAFLTNTFQHYPEIE